MPGKGRNVNGLVFLLEDGESVQVICELLLFYFWQLNVSNLKLQV